MSKCFDGQPNHIPGIYKIQSLIKPERFYIGSAVNMGARWRTHRSALLYNKHVNPKLQHHYNKYGKDDLVFSVIFVCNPDFLIPLHGVIEVEQYFVDLLNPWFNIAPVAGSLLGYKFPNRKKPVFSKEASINKSKALLAFYQTEEGKLSAKLNGISRRGKKKPPDFGAKISFATSGEKHHQFGKPLKESTKKKMSIVRTNKKQSESTKAKRVISVQLTKKKKAISRLMELLLNNIHE